MQNPSMTGRDARPTRFLPASCLALAALLLGGCNNAQWMSGRIEPHTSVKFVPPTAFHPAPEIVFDDTKNNTIIVRDVKFNRETGLFELGELSILNDSSGVINADAARMPLILEMQKRAFDHYDTVSNNVRSIFEKGIETGGKIAGLALPGATLTGPLGLGASVSNAGLDALAEQLLPKLLEKLAGNAGAKTRTTTPEIRNTEPASESGAAGPTSGADFRTGDGGAGAGTAPSASVPTSGLGTVIEP